MSSDKQKRPGAFPGRNILPGFSVPYLGLSCTLDFHKDSCPNLIPQHSIQDSQRFVKSSIVKLGETGQSLSSDLPAQQVVQPFPGGAEGT